MAFEYILFTASLLVLVSVAVAKFSDNLGVPTLLLFLGIGMLAGSEGPGGIYFDDARAAQSVGIVALALILFAGGLDTRWKDVRPILAPAMSLATLGVLLTALSVALFVVVVLDVSLLSGLLLGAIISSTDAAAVFAVLRSKNVSLKGKLKPLLEMESGSNDPMAVFLTIGTLQLMTTAESTWYSIVVLFVVQMGLGGALGFGFGKLTAIAMNRLRLDYEGIYPVFSLACVGLIYTFTALIGGSGFLAVYVAGLTLSNSDFVQKRSLLRFFDGLAWLSQITMFLTLGLLVYPSNIVPIVGVGLLVSGFLMFVARPVSVYLSLLRSSFTFREHAFISWVGLRGAVPIVLATFPLLAGIPDASLIFNVVFFIVLTSALLQGWSMPLAARLLHVDAPMKKQRKYPIEFAPVEGVDTELVDLIVPYESNVVGRSIIELGMPQDSLVVLISRDDGFIVPSGGTVLQGGDTILVLVNKENLPVVRGILETRAEEESKPTVE